MKILSANQIALLLPVTILIHQVEEYFAEFPRWYSNLLNADLSNQDFLVINGIGLVIFTAFAVSYLYNKNNLILVALGTLVFMNGMLHFGLSVFTFTYSPGTISGVVLFIPLGIFTFIHISPLLELGEKIVGMAIGILVLFVAGLMAMNI